MAFAVTMVVLVTGIVVFASLLGKHLRAMREQQAVAVRASPRGFRAKQPRRRPF
jgi:hypothetical protein